MKKNRIWMGSALFAICLGTAVSGIAMGDDEGEWGDRKWSRQGYLREQGVAPVSDKRYASECGACHFAYPAGLLPARSWRRIMSDLDEHFGEDASLSRRTKKALTRYLVHNAGDVRRDEVSRKLLRRLSAREAPLRITHLPYFRRKHGEIPSRMIAGNPRVRSLSNCQACHTQAARGVFEEETVRIPGYGRWHD